MSRELRSAIRPAGRAVDAIVIGAGHAGLAMSRCLAERSIDHVVLERGEVANSWRRERWDSLRLLTPNWQAKLPGYAYSGSCPDGYMTSAEVIAFIERYAGAIGAPVRTGTRVTAVEPCEHGYRVVTERGEWFSRAVVMASGAFNRPSVPALSAALPAGIDQLTPHDYRNPGRLAQGGVLVVGASATGLQLAHEIHRSGRPVTLAVGEHIRMPRMYRGHDIQWWMHESGVLDQTYTEVDDIGRARRVPSPQLVGTPKRETLDLNVLRELGVRTVGRIVGIRDGAAQFSGSLRNHCAMADLKLDRLLDTFDEWAHEQGLDREIEPEPRPRPTGVDASPCLRLDLASAGIETVVWATGFRPDYSWLQAPAFDAKGRLQHDGGIVSVPGLYVMGLPFLRRRRSSFIHGAGPDAYDLSEHLVRYLRCGTAPDLQRAAGL